jgi:polyhydroxyalkanoate synthesis regulator phasin
MENIEERFRKFVYAGVGMAALAKDRLAKTIEEIVEKNKMNTEEGEKIMKDFVESTEKKAREMKENITRLLENVKNSAKNEPSDEIENLKKRVQILEDLMEKHNLK